MSEPATEAGRRLYAKHENCVHDYGLLMRDILAIEQEARADLAARIEQRLLVMRATREGTTHPYDNGCVDAIDQSIAIVREEASDDRRA